MTSAILTSIEDVNNISKDMDKNGREVRTKEMDQNYKDLFDLIPSVKGIIYFYIEYEYSVVHLGLITPNELKWCKN